MGQLAARRRRARRLRRGCGVPRVSWRCAGGGGDPATELCNAAAQGDEARLRLLVRDRGYDVDAGDDDKRTAMHLAASEGKLSMLTLLLELGASIAPVDRWGNTPLNDATCHRHYGAIQILKEVTPKAPRRRTSSNTAAGGDDLIGDSDEDVGDDSEDESFSREAANASLLPDEVSCTVAWEDLTVGRKLGEGAFGVVHEAKLRGDDVAVKVCVGKVVAPHVTHDSLRATHAHSTNEPTERAGGASGASGEADPEVFNFEREIRLLASLHHRHVVQFYAGGLLPNPFIVTELMERGSLDSALYSPDRSVRDEYSWARRGAKIVLDAAKGLRYLHALRPPIVHFDLKPANVLISADHVGKLSDVGGAKHCANTLTRALSLTQLYASPELRNDAVAGPPADVYSFGVMIHEVYRGQRPPPPAQRPFVLKKEWAVTPLLKRIGGRSDTGALCRVPARRPTAAELVEKLTPLVGHGN